MRHSPSYTHTQTHTHTNTHIHCIHTHTHTQRHMHMHTNRANDNRPSIARCVWCHGPPQPEEDRSREQADASVLQGVIIMGCRSDECCSVWSEVDG